MRSRDIKAGTRTWRALLIIGALVSLCVSDGVGPRLLPLPLSHGDIAYAEARQGFDPAASRAPAPTKGPGPRVEMAAAPQNRAGAGQQQVQVAAHAPGGVFEAPARVVVGVAAEYRPLSPVAAPALRPPGRAPPRLA